MGIFLTVLIGTVALAVFAVVLLVKLCETPTDEDLLKKTKEFDIVVDCDTYSTIYKYGAAAYAKTRAYKIKGPHYACKIGGTYQVGQTEEEAIEKCRVKLEDLLERSRTGGRKMTLKVVDDQLEEEINEI